MECKGVNSIVESVISQRSDNLDCKKERLIVVY